MIGYPILPTLQVHGKVLCLERPVVMGILNATPDSFYNQGAGSSVSELLESAAQMIVAGATLLDIGGASSRPGSDIISSEDEKQRVLPVIEAVRRNFPDVWLSIDTWRADVAKAAVQAGADMVNDISCGSLDSAMLATVAKLKVPYVMIHMQGTPQTMQQQPNYEDVVREVMQFFTVAIQKAQALGIIDIIVDVGFGFGKTVAHNYTLLRNLSTFHTLGRPLLAGISRKRMIYDPLNTDAAHALNGTTALHMIALQQGASILRAHDVKEAMECIKLYEAVHGA